MGQEISIIIVSYNVKDLLQKCLTRVGNCVRNLDCEIFVVDNNSGDGSADMVADSFATVRLIRSAKNIGFAAGNNLAIRQASGELILLLNPDSYLGDGSIEAMLGCMRKISRCGILGVRQVDENGVFQPSARRFPGIWWKLLSRSGLANYNSKSRRLSGPDFTDCSETCEADWVVGSCFLIRRRLLDEIGLLDERYFLYFEEVDFCLQAKRAGWKVFYFPQVSVTHIAGQSAIAASDENENAVSRSGKQLVRYRTKSELRYYRKNFGFCYTLGAASVELVTELAVWTRNLVRHGEQGRRKRAEATFAIKLIIATLIEDQCGSKL